MEASELTTEEKKGGDNDDNVEQLLRANFPIEPQTTKFDLFQMVIYEMIDQSLTVFLRFAKIYFISRYIPEAVSAYPLMSTAYATSNAFIYGKFQDQLYLAQQFGKLTSTENNTHEERSKIGMIYQQSLLLSLTISAPAVASLFLMSPLFRTMGVPSDLIELSSKMTIPLIPSIFIDFMNSSDRNLLKASKHRVFFAGSSILRHVVDIALLAPFLSTFSLKGIGYASLVGAVAEFIYNKIVFIYLRKFRQSHYIFNLKMLRREPRLYYYRQIFKESLPIFSSALAFFTSQLIFSSVIGKLGEDRAKLFGVMSTWGGIFEILPRSIILASSVFIAKALGEGEYSALRTYGNLPLLFIAIYTLLEIICVLIFSKQLTNFLIESESLSNFLQKQMKWLYMTFFFGSSCAMFQDNLNSNLQSIRATIYSFSSTIIIIGFIVPISLLTAYVFNLDLYGPDLGQFLGYTLSSIYLARQWMHHSRNEQTLDDLASNNRPDLSSFSFKNLCSRWAKLGIADYRRRRPKDHQSPPPSPESIALSPN